MEIGVIRLLFTKSLDKAIIPFLLIQLICYFFLVIGKNLINDWRCRHKFNLYYCKVKNNNDINHIYKRYAVVKDGEEIIFIEKKDINSFYIWELLQGHKIDYIMDR